MKPLFIFTLMFMFCISLSAQGIEGEASPLPLESSFGKTGSPFTSVSPGHPLQVLTGLTLVKATVIEGIGTITAPVLKEGTLGAAESGTSIGRKISQPLKVEKSGYIVAGLVVYEGLWYGQESVKQIKVLWKKIGTQETAESQNYGIGPEKNDKGRTVTIKVPDGKIAVGIHGLSSNGILNRVSLVVAQAPGKPAIPPRPPIFETQVQPPSGPQGPSVPTPNQILPPPRPEGPAPLTPTPESQTPPLNFKGLPSGKEYVPAENEGFESEVIKLVNMERQKAGLKALTLDTDLARAARYHAADMTFDRYFDHNSMDRQGSSTTKVGGAFDRIHKFSTKGHGENIAQGQTTPAQVMTSWMNSPGHKANILAARSTLIGVGYIKGTWVQVFGN